MAEKRSFQEKQYAFAAHIRDPEHRPAPAGVEDRRMAIYRELFFNNLRNLLGTTFPVLRKIHTDRQWERFIRAFMQQHQAKTPYFLELPEEFLAFLQNEYEPAPDDFPFLVELAHYEYIELALSVAEGENDLDGIDPGGDLLANIPVKSVLAWVYAYQYPVQRISKNYLPQEPSSEPVYLCIYRNSKDKVGFLELNPVSAGLLNAIEENACGKTGEQILRDFAAAIDYANVAAFIEHGESALNDMRELEILVGTRARQS